MPGEYNSTGVSGYLLASILTGGITHTIINTINIGFLAINSDRTENTNSMSGLKHRKRTDNMEIISWRSYDHIYTVSQKQI